MAQLDAVVRLKGGVSTALKMLRHVSFASHDLWHEVAFRRRLDLASVNATPVDSGHPLGQGARKLGVGGRQGRCGEIG
jgi:hypothetical protein